MNRMEEQRGKARPTVHMIGNAHLDPVWLWQWQEGFAETKATFRSALDRMKEFPEFIFTCAGAASYKWIEDNDPAMFAEITNRVAEGRWVIAGGWWVQPDCNLPSGESFARHSLYGQRYFLEKFGKAAKVGYNVDSFGHHAMMPQLLKLSGMEHYVFMRPDKREKELPADLFLWEGADGSRVTAYRIPGGYNTHQSQPASPKIAEALEQAGHTGTDAMCFYGVGNHGGGPTIANIHEIRAMQHEHGKDAITFSSPDAFFDKALPGRHELPVVTGDMQHHASGCYSAHSETKLLNRKAEQRLLTAEKLSVAAHCLLGHRYETDFLRQAWETIMFNQFHDIMGGCCIREAYEDAREGYGHALYLGGVVQNGALQRISWAVDTMREGIGYLDKNQERTLWEQHDLGVPVVVFNPHSWSVTAPVVVTQQMKGATDESGKALSIQHVRASRTNGGDKYDTLFMAEVPAYGYRLYWIYRNKSHEAATVDQVAATETSLENELVHLAFDKRSGGISRLLDKRSGVDLINGIGGHPIVIDESECDTWGHNMLSFRKETGRFGEARLSVAESGPLRATLRTTSVYGQSTMRQDFTIYAGSPVVHVKVKLDWREKHNMLKLAFPLALEQPAATYEIPYGYLERPVNGEEEPAQRWVDVSGLTEQGKRAGLALLNDGKYAFDVLDSELRMTAARGAIYADHYGERDEWCEYMDQGVQEFRYALVPHEGDWRAAGVVREAAVLNQPLLHVVETYHKGSLPPVLEGVRVSVSNVAVEAVKLGEDEDGYMVRCRETDGRAAEATIECHWLNRTWTAKFGCSEIKTFKLPFDLELEVSEVNLLELQ
ncbi:alpha-mannosidase [Paenibacillus sp. PAMC21692]|nr:alpha-mannosidase [Paenibacillus sp. PAMC21692]